MSSPLASSVSSSTELPPTRSSHDASSSSNLPKTNNFLTQLEAMMGAVKKEASTLENMKAKLKEMEELKNKFQDMKNKYAQLENVNLELKRNLLDSDSLNQEIRNDMQKLNDLYQSERMKISDLQQVLLRKDQDISTLHHEKDMIAKETLKIPELKKLNKSLKSAMNQLKQAHEDEKKAYQLTIHDLEKKHIALETTKEEMTSHFWNMKSEIDQLQKDKVDHESFFKEHKQKEEAMKSEILLYYNRLYMMAEDRINSVSEVHKLQKEKNAQISQLDSEKQGLHSQLFHLQIEYDLLNQKYKLYEESALEQSKIQVNNITLLQDTMKELSNKNMELVKDHANLKNKLTTKNHENEKIFLENEKLKQQLTNTEFHSQQMEMELISSNKILQQEKTELANNLTHITSLYENLNNSNKSEKDKLWQEIEKLKEVENTLLEENERFHFELQEKNLLIQSYENDKKNLTSMTQYENQQSHHIIQTLKDELEKRLQDLMSLRSERDELVNQKTQHDTSLSELKNEFVQKENILKRTLETDRNKLKQEMIARANRIKALEGEKQELLNETNELVAQIAEARRANQDNKNVNEVNSY